jgi:hypothetical protein
MYFDCYCPHLSELIIGVRWYMRIRVVRVVCERLAVCFDDLLNGEVDNVGNATSRYVKISLLRIFDEIHLPNSHLHGIPGYLDLQELSPQLLHHRIIVLRIVAGDVANLRSDGIRSRAPRLDVNVPFVQSRRVYISERMPVQDAHQSGTS